MLRRGRDYCCILALHVLHWLYTRKEVFREVGRNIICFKIWVNTAGLVRISKYIDGFLTGNVLDVSGICFMVCSALIVADVTVGIVLHLRVSVCASLRKDDEKFWENIFYFTMYPGWKTD